jgi:hypothetical protein
LRTSRSRSASSPDSATTIIATAIAR